MESVSMDQISQNEVEVVVFQETPEKVDTTHVIQ
jgi:hypothetical protein